MLYIIECMLDVDVLFDCYKVVVVDNDNELTRVVQYLLLVPDHSWLNSKAEEEVVMFLICSCNGLA